MVSIRLLSTLGSASSWSKENKALIGTSSAFARATVFSKDGLLRPVSRLLRQLISIFGISYLLERRRAALLGDLHRKAQNATGQIPDTDHGGMPPWLGLQLEGLH